MALEEYNIGEQGELFVVQYLKDIGYIVKHDTKLPGSTDIEAIKGNVHFLIQVKTAMAPQEPVSLSSDEERDIKSRAARIGTTAYEAKVQLNTLYQLIGDIKWRNLQ